MKVTSIICIVVAALFNGARGADPSPPESLAPERSLEETLVEPLPYSNDELTGAHDFSWGLEPEQTPRFVRVTKNETTGDAMIVLNFKVGESAPTKEFRVSVLDDDCSTEVASPQGLVVSQDNRQRTKLRLAVTVDESVIDSNFFESGRIRFCLSVEYVFVSPKFSSELTMNFRNVAIFADVDQEADFSIHDVQTTVSFDAVQTDLDLKYTINAAFCDGLDPLTVFPQGSVFDLCVSAPANASYNIDSIKSLVMSQKGTSSIAAIRLIWDYEDSHFALTKCVGGACRIKVLIPVVFHTGEAVLPLSLSGTALLKLENNRTRYVRRSLFVVDKEEKLPEDSTGFRAEVYVTNPEDSETSSSANGGAYGIITALLVVGVFALPIFH